MRGQSVFGSQRRYFHIVFFVSGILVLSYLVRSLTSSHYRENWDELAATEARNLLNEASGRFIALQRDTRRIATDLAGNSVIVSYLEGRTIKLSPLFREVDDESRKYNAGIEVFDRQAQLIAWSGTSGPLSERDINLALEGKLSSYIIPSPLYSQLLVTTPVRTNGAVTGAVVIRKIIDSHFPLNNRYVESDGLSESIRRELGVPVRFEFSRPGGSDSMAGYLSTPLIGIDSTRIGTISVPAPSLSSTLTGIETGFSYLHAILQITLLLFVVLILTKAIGSIRHVLLKSIVVTALIWCLRYLLLWLEIPSGFLDGQVFDPAFYATTFGSGLAKSIGELTLTSVALLINTLLVTRFIVGNRTARHEGRVRGRIVSLGGAVVSTLVFFLLLRAYGVLIRSAVFDSALRYNDPAVIIPSFELALMVVNLFTLSLCIIIASAGLLFLCVSLLSREGQSVAWGVTAVLIVTGALLAGSLGSKNLMTWEYRLLFSAAMILYSYYLSKVLSQGVPGLSPGGLLIPLGLSALFLYPQLDARIGEKDQERLEVFASEVLRPVDSWLTFVVDDALNNFRNEETLEILHRGSEEEKERIALTVWSNSAACREGYNSLFLLTDSLGKEISRFSIGDQNVLPEKGLISNPPGLKSIQVREIGTGLNAFKVYRGSVPLSGSEGLLGHAFVLIAAGEQAFFRGDLPFFLRSPGPESIESFYRPVTVVEFRGGSLYTSTGDLFPVGADLPSGASRRIREQRTGPAWITIPVGDQEYQTLVVQGDPQIDQVVLLCMPVQGIASHLFNLVKVLVYYMLVVLVVLVSYLGVRWVRRMPYQPTFRDRLLVALLVTAVAPLVVIAYYGKDFAEQRLMEETAGRLQRETSAIAVQVSQKSGRDGGLPEEVVEGIAVEVDADFNYYKGTRLSSTSRPELYAAGFLDRRLSGTAYSAVVIDRARFFHQTENVGRYQYAVGYRPVLSEGGEVLGVVSVPTIYRQDDLDRQISRQNAFLFGVYALVFLLV
ncbi:MAG: hypothetical protein OEV30_07085, partial [Ignavibacteria bacterium]|nr:hypothetical protein [Ignavibacteria bacterium]